MENRMPQCMDKYKNDFAIEFAKLMQKNSQKWKKVQYDARLELLSPSSFGYYLLWFLGGFIPGTKEREYNLKLHFIFAIGTLIAGIITNIQMQNKNYQNEVKRTLFPNLLKIFGNISYGRLLTRISKEKLTQSELFPNEKITQKKDDDCFTGEYNGVNFTINETDFGYTGNNNKYAQVFKGLAMHFSMNKKIKSRVLIMSKEIGQCTPANYEKVEFEYEKFNKKYNVYVQKTQMEAGGQIEARYLLNTAFMERFMQISTSFKIDNMQCSIFGDSILILLSTNKDLFEMNHLLKKVDDINQYKTLFDEFASVLSFIDVLNLSSRTGL